MNRLLTQAELQERVDASIERAAASEGITVAEFFICLSKAWNAAIARDEREEAAGLWNG